MPVGKHEYDSENLKVPLIVEMCSYSRLDSSIAMLPAKSKVYTIQAFVFIDIHQVCWCIAAFERRPRSTEEDSSLHVAS